MDPFKLLKSHREVELNVACGIRVMCKIKVIVEAIIPLSKANHRVPLHPFFFPEFIPLHLFTRLHEELHLHLLKFPHAENKLPRDNFIAECLSYLGDSKRNFHSTGLLYVKKIYENTLRSL